MDRARIFVVALLAGAAACGSSVTGDGEDAEPIAMVSDGFDGFGVGSRRTDEPAGRSERDAVDAEKARLVTDDFQTDASPNVTSIATAPDGSRYVVGVFSGSIRFGSAVLESHGGDDVFIACIRPGGVVAWAHAVGSKRDESGPRVSVSDGRVKLIAMTNGAVDCGRGPLNTWSSETFFLCTFDRDGAPIDGASFPTGRQ